MTVKTHQPLLEEVLEGYGDSALDGVDKNGNVDLGIKDNPEAYRELPWQELETSYSINWQRGTNPYQAVQQLSPLQQAIVAAVDSALQNQWYFRQARKPSIAQQFSVTNPVDNELTGANDKLPFVLIYQRKNSTPSEEILTSGEELLGIARKVAEAEVAINSATGQRYELESVEANYDHNSELGRRGAGGGDARILILGLYFEDRQESLYKVQQRLAAGERQQIGLRSEEARLEQLLGVQKQ